MKIKHWHWWLLIFILAIILRFYNLAAIPPSLNWDEVAIGWNANTIFHTRRDEFGTYLPLTFKSFGDYKAPVLIYLTAPFVGLFGLEPWAVRLPSVLAGIATCLIMYFLAKEISWLLKIKNNNLFALISMFLLAISPWHLLFSRPAFEPNLALMFIVIGSWLFLVSLRESRLWLLSGISFILSLYTYHSPKLFLPIFLIGLSLIFKRELIKSIKGRPKLFAFYIILLISLAYPLIKVNFNEGGSQRLSSTSIFYDDKQQLRDLSVSLLKDIGANYFAHLKPQFYLQRNSDNTRLSLKNYGLMPILQYAVMIVGFILLLRYQKNQGVQILLLWFLAGFIPAVIGKDVIPHNLRSLNGLPAVILISGFGFNKVVSWAMTRRRLTYFLIICALVFILDYGRFIRDYFWQYPVYSAADWQYGYQEVVRFAKTYEDQVDKIVISSAYGQPHIFTYFYQQRDPMEIFWGWMSKYSYGNINWEADQYLKNYLLVGAADEIPNTILKDKGEIIKEINYPDGRVAFRIARTF